MNEPTVESAAPKHQIEGGPSGSDSVGTEDEDPEAKRRRILEETRDIDADSDGSEDDSSEEERYATWIRRQVSYADKFLVTMKKMRPPS